MQFSEDKVGSFEVLIYIRYNAFLFSRGKFLDFPDGTEGKAKLRDREWSNQDLNFDNVHSAMLTLFTVATFEGWPS